MACEAVRMPKPVLVLPIEWRELQAPAPLQRAYGRPTIADKLLVVVTEEYHKNQWWRHVSCSMINQIPSWEYLRMVKDIFIGRSEKAIQVLPPESQYVNIHPNVLHLWCPLDKDPLPDFRTKGMI